VEQTPPRTLLEQIVRRSRRTLVENCAAFEKTAREAGENAVLSPRQLSRWMAGSVTTARPAAQRVAELQWGRSFEVLIGPPADAMEQKGDAGTLSLDRIGYPGPHQTETVFSDLLNPAPAAIPAQVPLVPSPGAAALAGAAPLFDVVDPDERERLAGVLHNPSRLDAATLAHYEAMVTNLKRQEDLLGPRTVLPAILAQRHLVGGLVAAAPDELKPRALSVYAQLSLMVGWSLFNLGDYQNASYYYDDARTAAHDAQNVDLVTYVLCTMSHLHTWMGKPRVGIDHAVAAASWARQTDSPHARAYAADVAVRAYLADHQLDNAWRALADEYTALRDVRPDQPASPWWYFFDDRFTGPRGLNTRCGSGTPTPPWTPLTRRWS
jgi:hypothetical protein